MPTFDRVIDFEVMVIDGDIIKDVYEDLPWKSAWECTLEGDKPIPGIFIKCNMVDQVGGEAFRGLKNIPIHIYDKKEKALSYQRYGFDLGEEVGISVTRPELNAWKFSMDIVLFNQIHSGELGEELLNEGLSDYTLHLTKDYAKKMATRFVKSTFENLKSSGKLETYIRTQARIHDF